MATEVKATQVSGNTKPSTVTKARAFQLTLNEVEKWENLKNYLTSSKMLTYIIACEEIAPTTGHKHIHCYVHFNRAKALSIKKCQGAHIELCKGSPKQNIEYIRKDGKIIFEQGDEPHQGSSLTIKELRQIKNSDDLPDWRQYNIWKQVINEPKETTLGELRAKKRLTKPIEVTWITGPSGSGKSNLAEDLAIQLDLDDDVKLRNITCDGGFFDGLHDGTGVAIYDEFRDSHMPANKFIQLIDYRSHSLPIKGGFVTNNFTHIFITSVQNPYEIYKNAGDEPHKQWLRRMRVIRINNDGTKEEIKYNPNENLNDWF